MIGDIQTSKFIMTSVMTGVPAFGPNLMYVPASTTEMLKAWLQFYRSYRADFATGGFSPFGQLKMPNHKIEAGLRTFAYIRNLDFSELLAGGRTIFLMNATDADHFTGKVRGPAEVTSYSVQVFNRFLGAEAHSFTVVTDSNGGLDLNLAVEEGGMIVLEGLTNETADEPQFVAPESQPDGGW
jgi:hypothetical protein